VNLPIQYTRWLDAVLAIARHYGLSTSAESARVALAWQSDASLDVVLERLARQAGLDLRLRAFSIDQLNPQRLPPAVEFKARCRRTTSRRASRSGDRRC